MTATAPQLRGPRGLSPPHRPPVPSIRALSEGSLPWKSQHFPSGFHLWITKCHLQDHCGDSPGGDKSSCQATWAVLERDFWPKPPRAAAAVPSRGCSPVAGDPRASRCQDRLRPHTWSASEPSQLSPKPPRPRGVRVIPKAGAHLVEGAFQSSVGIRKLFIALALPTAGGRFL